jgi:DNA invertase Pin-like site-specific DNA recombinase
MAKNKNARIALCYIRLSSSKQTESATAEGSRNTPVFIEDSPDRQRANIEAECAKRGWIPEWHTDVHGHRSGREENNRPGWMALQRRIGDPDVVAIVANDLARLHRKGWRVGRLLDLCHEHGLELVMAAPGRQIDFTGIAGRMMASLIGMMDEWYAEDLSMRAKNAIVYRKRQGKVINLPFGSARDTQGFMIPTTDGAWLLSNGKHQKGKENEPPEPGALWRGYYECAKRILELYAENQLGAEGVAYQVNIEGYAFRDRRGNPRLIDKDDVRRVIRLWPEYGGVILPAVSKKRPAREGDLTVTLNPERTIFPIALLVKVGKVLKERSRRAPKHGVRREVRTYALNGLVYCAACEERAKTESNVRLRSRLNGKIGRGNPYYRHREGIKGCGCNRRMIAASQIESDIGRLLQMLVIRPDELARLLEIARMQAAAAPNEDDLETKRTTAIAQCRRRIAAAVDLYGEGFIDKTEFERRIESNEAEIADWEARSVTQQKTEMELTIAVQQLEKLAELWGIAGAADRQRLARSIFNYIVYDLDAQQIGDFVFKPWVEKFLDLYVQLQTDEEGNPMKYEFSTTWTTGGLGGTRTHGTQFRKLLFYPLNYEAISLLPDYSK